jgi:tRNA A-37 threonylcarbamoyl transferase component Bud32/dipeptidyl aminopeptidase/acylaminoacyl peptidase
VSGTADRLEQIQRAFGAYSVERELGSGGMATVYLAHDKKHDRKVAIKILHAELAAVLGAERFLQEIRVTANLQHPHILGLIDSGIIGEGDLQGRPYYVMPFVSGESLRQRLDKEQQLPVHDAVRIATEVASALDYAHRHNIIHRDIKPENILLHDGSAIVADFGIALAVTQAGGARMTQTGLSLGTPSYMSPEQAMGERTITARSDIYSLGAVAYEMLSGEPPFTGPTVQAIVARVMTEEPRSLTQQRRSVPAHVDAAVSRALEKLPADRFASAREFSDALNNASSATVGSSAKTGRSSGRSTRALYGVSTLAVLLAIAALWGWMRPTTSKRVVRYNFVLDSSEAMVGGGGFWGRMALSRNGSYLAYVGVPRGTLWIRARDQLHGIAVPGSDGANTPFFSPDGRSVGYMRSGRMEFIPSSGGAPTVVTDTLVGVAGASWARDGFIYADAFGAAALVKVEAKAGAVPKWFTTLDSAKGETDHIWPDVLPNGKGVLFTVVYGGRNDANGRRPLSIAVAEVPSGKHRILLNGATFARYSPSGHLLYVTTDRALMMVPFDQNSMTVKGEPTTVVESVRLGTAGSADLGVSSDGTLIYATGANAGNGELVWVTRDGKAQPVDSTWQGYFSHPALSPDGKELALTVTSGANRDVWIKQLDKGPAARLTLDGRSNLYPAWTPDGRSVTYTNIVQQSLGVFTKRADGSSQAVLQLKSKTGVGATWSPDGKWVIYRTDRQGPGASDIMAIRPGVDTAPIPLVATRFTEFTPAISRDSKWLAYASNESGRYEIYVVPFPNTSAAKWIVSTAGGTEPRWSHRGNELFYRDAAGNMVAAEVRTNPVFSVMRTTILFSASRFGAFEASPQYDVSADDQRFLMLRPLAGSDPDRLIVVENWFEELGHHHQ